MSQFNQIGFYFFYQILVSDPLYIHDFQISVCDGNLMPLNKLKYKSTLLVLRNAKSTGRLVFSDICLSCAIIISEIIINQI